MKYIIVAIIILTSFYSATAQSQNTFFEFNAGYNIHDVNTKIKKGDKNLGSGLIISGGFGHYFTEHIGITLGVKYSTAKTTTKLDYNDHIDQATDKQTLLDTPIKNLDIQYANLKENTEESIIFVPVGISYRQKLGSKLLLDARINIESGFVVQQYFKTKSGSINVSNSYINTYNGVDVEVENVSQLNQYGAGNAGTFSGETKMKKNIFAAGASVGIVFPITQRLALTANIHGTYSLSDQKKKDFPHIFDGENYVGITQSALCTKIHPYTIGCTLGVKYFISKK